MQKHFPPSFMTFYPEVTHSTKTYMKSEQERKHVEIFQQCLTVYTIAFIKLVQNLKTPALNSNAKKKKLSINFSRSVKAKSFLKSMQRLEAI